MNIIDMKKAVIDVMKKYENMVKKAVADLIREAMCELQDDHEDNGDNTYYVEILTEEESVQATDKEFDMSERQRERILNTLKECKYELYRLLDTMGLSCQVDAYLYHDNSIGFDIEADGIKIEIEYENRYNK